MAVKKTAKKAVKPAAKKAAKPAAKPAAKKVALVKDKPMSKSQIATVMAEHVGISKKQAVEAMDVLVDVIHAHLKKGAVGHMKFAGLMNIKAVKKPARKARKGVNPFTGQEIMIAAKPAYRSVRVLALKALKGMAEE